MVTNDRPACASTNKGPSYGELLGRHEEVVASILKKACEIQCKLVPTFELPPKEEAGERPEDPTLFGGLAREFQDLIEIDKMLDTVVRML